MGGPALHVSYLSAGLRERGYETILVAGSVGQFLLNQAFRYGEVSLLAPIEYVTLLWATLFGFAVWGQLPGAAVLMGAAIIIASTLYIVQREARLRRAVAKGAP